MKTKILLMGFIIFLVNVISVNAMEIIKSCNASYVKNGFNFIVFPTDGGKPYGADVEALLSLTNKLNLELKIEEDNFFNCVKKLKSGEIDIFIGIDDKNDEKNYMFFINYIK